MKYTPGKIYDEEHAVRVLRWRRPVLLRGFLVSLAGAAVCGMLTIPLGAVAAVPGVALMVAALVYFLRIGRLQRKLEELGG